MQELRFHSRVESESVLRNAKHDQLEYPFRYIHHDRRLATEPTAYFRYKIPNNVKAFICSVDLSSKITFLGQP